MHTKLYKLQPRNDPLKLHPLMRNRLLPHCRQTSTSSTTNREPTSYIVLKIKVKLTLKQDKRKCGWQRPQSKKSIFLLLRRQFTNTSRRRLITVISLLKVPKEKVRIVELISSATLNSALLAALLSHCYCSTVRAKWTMLSPLAIARQPWTPHR